MALLALYLLSLVANAVAMPFSVSPTGRWLSLWNMAVGLAALFMFYPAHALMEHAGPLVIAYAIPSVLLLGGKLFRRPILAWVGILAVVVAPTWALSQIDGLGKAVATLVVWYVAYQVVEKAAAWTWPAALGTWKEQARGDTHALLGIETE